jgi:hypothetical protein
MFKVISFAPAMAGQYKTQVRAPDVDHTVEKVVTVIGIVGYKRYAQKRRAEGKSAVKKDAFPVPGMKKARNLALCFTEDSEPGIDQGGNTKNNNERERKSKKPPYLLLFQYIFKASGNKFLFTHFTPP